MVSVLLSKTSMLAGVDFDSWATEGQDIGWAESVALELAIYWLIKMGFHDADIIMHLDNTGVIGPFQMGDLTTPHKMTAFAT